MPHSPFPLNHTAGANAAARAGAPVAGWAAAAIAAVLALAGCATSPDAPESAATRPASTAATAPSRTEVATAAAVAGAAAAATAQATPTPPPANQAPGAARPPGPAVNAAAAAAAAAAATAQGMRPFADVIKDATESRGLVTLWQKDDRVWLELSPEQFGKLYFLTSNLNRGIGENRIFGGMMNYPAGITQVVEFRKVGALVQLIAKNTKYTARAGTPEARAVAAGFSDSLVATVPVASQPHPERKSILVDANALFVADLPAAAITLERTYRQPYAFDARNSSLDRARARPDLATFEVTAHYALSRPQVAPAYMPGAPVPSSVPSLPNTLPDVRSLFLGFYYSLVALPETPMRPRAADERVGYFTAETFDYTSDVPRTPVQRHVTRWRLEKKDPAAALSEPKQPIVFWLDRNIPLAYREPVRAGILEWNKAFERIGYKDALKVEVQPDDADFDTADVRHASVRWQAVAKTSFGAIGMSVVDPRSGEILDADIGVDAMNVRAVRNLRAETVPAAAGGASAMLAPADAAYCEYGDRAAAEAVFGLSLLEARGELAPDSPDVERFVAAYVKDMVMHETGHALGLRHNFRASTAYTQAQLADPEFTRVNGISGSVMEYNAWNLARRGERQGEYVMNTLGPYDYWAVEFGYRELAPDDEAVALAAVAARSSEPVLAYATDEELAYGALDPAVNSFDLGADPLAYAQKRFALVRELWERTEAKALQPGESYSVLRRNVTRGLGEAQEGALYATKYIGGLTTLRDRAGSGREPLSPIDVDKQRAALALLATEVFSADSFRFSPALLRRMAVSPFDRDDARELGRTPPSTDLAVDQQLLTLQRMVLAQLMGDTIAQRLVNNEAKVDRPDQALRLSELYATLHVAIWSELKSGGDIPLARRNLQREYTVRVAASLLRPTGSMPADARALLRADAQRLSAELAQAQGKRGRSAEAHAHLVEMRATIDEALKAPLVRQAT